MFVKNLNATQQSALLALANHISEQIPAELQIYENQSFSVIDAVFGSKNGKDKFKKLDILKRQMEKDTAPMVVDITKLNQIFNTQRAKLSVIGALVWLNGYNKDTRTDAHVYRSNNGSWHVLNIDVAQTIFFYSQLLKLNFDSEVKPFYNWYVAQQNADDIAGNIFPIPDPFNKVDVKG